MRWTPSRTIVILLAVATAHIVATWCYADRFYGDLGRWFHEVERFAQGQVPYRDFTWGFPPLPLWVLGFAARIFGTQVPVILVCTALLFLGIAALYAVYVHKVLANDPLAPLAGVTGLCFAVGMACHGSAPLPLGMYQPGAPFGLFFLMAAAIPLTELAMGRLVTTRVVALAGACLAGAILSKHDFWIPAAYGLASVFLLTKGPRRRAVLLTAFCVPLIVAGGIIGVTSGMGTITNIVIGSGQARISGTRGYPYGSRLTIELLAIAGLTCVVAGALRAWKTLCLGGALFGLGLIIYSRYDVVHLSRVLGEIEQQLFPPALPVILLLVVAWRSPPGYRSCILLLGFCATLYARRLFEYVEWFQVLLSLPVYVYTLRLLAPKAGSRVYAAVLTGLLLISVDEYRREAPGWPHHRGTMVVTHKGKVRFTPEAARDYRMLDAVLAKLDPERRRPLAYLGMAGGYCYFFDRPCALPTDLSLTFSHKPLAQLEQDLQAAPGVILLERAGVRESSMPAPDFRFQWNPASVPGYIGTIDAGIIDRKKATCTEVAGGPFSIYDCQK